AVVLYAQQFHPGLVQDIGLKPTLTFLFIPYLLLCIGWSLFDFEFLGPIPISKPQRTLIILCQFALNSFVWILIPFSLFFWLNGWTYPHLYLCIVFWFFARILQAAVLTSFHLLRPYLEDLRKIDKAVSFYIACAWWIPITGLLPWLDSKNAMIFLSSVIYEPDPETMIRWMGLAMVGACLSWIIALSVHRIPTVRQSIRSRRVLKEESNRSLRMNCCVGEPGKGGNGWSLFSPWTVFVLYPFLFFFYLRFVELFLVDGLPFVSTAHLYGGHSNDYRFFLIFYLFATLLYILTVPVARRILTLGDFIHLWQTLPIPNRRPAISIILLGTLVSISYAAGKNFFYNLRWLPESPDFFLIFLSLVSFGLLFIIIFRSPTNSDV
ncbi:MAG: hypothetical protein KC994_26785, partial [Candidatus Omnitrophica bacterium]|nr:hypothetical protein [Candidatus Omnitrophota bacterium]